MPGQFHPKGCENWGARCATFLTATARAQQARPGPDGRDGHVPFPCRDVGDCPDRTEDSRGSGHRRRDPASRTCQRAATDSIRFQVAGDRRRSRRCRSEKGRSRSPDRARYHGNDHPGRYAPAVTPDPAPAPATAAAPSTTPASTTSATAPSTVAPAVVTADQPVADKLRDLIATKGARYFDARMNAPPSRTSTRTATMRRSGATEVRRPHAPRV